MRATCRKIRSWKKAKQPTFLCDITNNILLCGWKEPYFRATEAFGANSKEEPGGLKPINTPTRGRVVWSPRQRRRVSPTTETCHHLQTTKAVNLSLSEINRAMGITKNIPESSSTNQYRRQLLIPSPLQTDKKCNNAFARTYSSTET